jgi:hypothetical protein
MKCPIALVPLIVIAAAATAVLAGCADRDARGRGTYEAPRSALDGAPPGRPAHAHGVAGYRGFCEEHGRLIGTTADEADVDRIVAAHNAAYHRVAGSRFWIGEKIAVLADDGSW